MRALVFSEVTASDRVSTPGMQRIYCEYGTDALVCQTQATSGSGSLSTQLLHAVSHGPFAESSSSRPRGIPRNTLERTA